MAIITFVSVYLIAETFGSEMSEGEPTSERKEPATS
jgi:hypothetical protein